MTQPIYDAAKRKVKEHPKKTAGMGLLLGALITYGSWLGVDVVDLALMPKTLPHEQLALRKELGEVADVVAFYVARDAGEGRIPLDSAVMMIARLHLRVER